MTQEFKKIVEAALKAKAKGLKTVVATVVDVDGSAYRGPGVRMLVIEGNSNIGAVSGGCVEHDIQQEAEYVFADSKSRIITYDGRYRAGCEGVLYILIELFNPSKDFLNAYTECMQERNSFQINSKYKREVGAFDGLGSEIVFNKKESIAFVENKSFELEDAINFSQELPACLKLIIFGTEHDATQLSLLASLSGWEVQIISVMDQSCGIHQFPGARSIKSLSLADYSNVDIDEQTSVVIMSHNFAKDLAFLLEIKHKRPNYIGILGSKKRKEKLFSDFYENAEDVADEFIDLIHAPAGLNIGAITPQEISISIISEMLTVIRKTEPIKLSLKV